MVVVMIALIIYSDCSVCLIFRGSWCKVASAVARSSKLLKPTLTQHSQPSEEKRLVDQGAVRAASGGEGGAGGEQVRYS